MARLFEVVFAIGCVGCSIPSLDLNGKSCPCPAPWVCGTDNTCHSTLPTDAATDAADAMVDSGSCALSAWSQPAIVPGLPSASDPAERGDHLQAWYVKTNVTTYGIFTATRVATTVAYHNEVIESFTNPLHNDVDPNVTADGLDLVFASDRDGLGYRAYEATRATPDAAFSAAKVVAGLETVVLATSPNGGIGLSRDGLVAYVPTTDSTLVRIARPDRKTPFAMMASFGFGAKFPTFSATELELFYNCTTGVCVRTRATTAASFGPEAMFAAGADPALVGDDLEMLYSTGSIVRITRTCL